MKPKIVFPEGNDPRIKQAAQILREQAICEPVLIGVDVPEQDRHENAVWQGAEMVVDGQAHAIVAGAVNSTKDVLRAYIKVLGMAEGVHRLTSCFYLKRKAEQYILADCAVNITPDAATLAETAQLSAAFAAAMYDFDPKVAFFSLATGDDMDHPAINHVRDAVKLTREQDPALTVAGPIQVDAAVSSEIATTKGMTGSVPGNANIFIYPDLNSGNIAYKTMERFAGFAAVGPLLLGCKYIAHDLSRGCSVDDIVAVATVAAKQCQMR